MARMGPNLVERLPEAKRAIADGQFGSVRQAALLEIDEQFAPTLRALANPNLQADQLLAAFRRRADQNQHAFGLILHPGLQINAVRPDIDVASGGKVALLPAAIVPLPFARQPGDDRRRQVRSVPAKQRAKRLLEVARRDAAQIQNWQQSIQALRAPRPQRPRIRREPEAPTRRASATVTH